MANNSLASKIGFVLGPLLFVVFQFLVQPEGMSDAARSVLACTLWVATWWTTEAIPMAATSLLPIVVLPLTGGAAIDTVTAAYGNKILFLYMGGFIIAIAMEKWNLHKRIALTIISWVGTNSRGIVGGFIIATAFLSMWISNTATSLMMVTIGIALISQLGGIIDKAEIEDKERVKANLGKALMLSIAYAASIGGMGTLIGTPTNAVFSAIVLQLFDVEISFALWMAFAMPLVIIMLVVLWIYMVRVAFPLPKKPLAGGKQQIDDDLKALGKMSWEEKAVFAVFVLTAASWISSSFLLQKVLPGIDDTIIAMGGALVLFLIPAKSEENKMVMDWEAAVRLPWGIIVLFGGGLALAAGFKESGLAEWIGQQMSLLQGINLLLLIFLVALMLNFLTEVTSNVATASIMLPILASLALSINVHPFGLMIAATMAASCAFMLPIATPPNAIVFSFGHVEMKDMIRKGFALNVISTVLIALFVYFVMGAVLGIDLSVNPYR